MRNIIINALLFCFIALSNGSGDVIINEFAASNYASLRVNDSYPDWIELYNTADTAVDIRGYFLTDDSDDPFKWIFPTCVIEPYDFLIVIAYGEDTSFGDTLCTNFKLSRDGEFLGLYDRWGFPSDTITFGAQYPDKTFGRPLGGLHVWRYLENPTPGNPNDSIWGINITPEPQIYPLSGYYTSPQVVQITGTGTIMYSTDLSPPLDSGTVYVSSFTIDTTTVVRAQAIEHGKLPSKVVSRTYVFDSEADVPTVFITTDSRNLWNDTVGIYVVGLDSLNPNYNGRGREWERVCQIEILSNEDTITVLNAGLRIHGSSIRGVEKKPFRITFRGETIYKRLIPGFERDEYSQLVLRLGGEYRSKMRTPLMQLFGEQCGVLISHFHPVVVNLNGVFWGLYYLREYINPEYCNYHLGEGEYDVMDRGDARYGSDSAWVATKRFLRYTDLSTDSALEIATTLIDEWNLINYLSLFIWGQNVDWMYNNDLKVRRNDESGKWEWIVWDVDWSLGVYISGVFRTDIDIIPTVEERFQPFSLVMQNLDFRRLFINRLADLMNTLFSPENAIITIDSLANTIESTVEVDNIRWRRSYDWYEVIDSLRQFGIRRPDYVRAHIIVYFGLDDTAIVHIARCSGGRVALNTLPSDSVEFEGIYFAGIPITLKAIPNPGYKFISWRNDSVPDSFRVECDPVGGLEVAPLFVPYSMSYDGLTINELMAKNDSTICDSASEYDDWIELYNCSSDTINLSGCCVSDDLSDTFKYCFDEDIFLLPMEFKVIWCDDDTGQGIMHMPFKLTSRGEWVGVFAPPAFGSFLIDSLRFPELGADISYGRFEECIDSFGILDYPTPLESNEPPWISEYKSLPEAVNLSVIPNPFNSSCRITAPIGSKIEIYNLQGKLVWESQSQKEHINKDEETFSSRGEASTMKSFVWQPDKSIGSGVYLVSVSFGKWKLSKKIVYLK